MDVGFGVIRDHLLATVTAGGDDIDRPAIARIVARSAGLSG
jgi:hypothetical protein